MCYDLDEKGKLLDHISGKAVIEGFGTTPSTKLTTNSERKVNTLLSILQTNPEEIAEAEARMREIEAAGDSKVRFQFIGEQGAREADLSL